MKLHVSNVKKELCQSPPPPPTDIQRTSANESIKINTYTHAVGQTLRLTCRNRRGGVIMVGGSCPAFFGDGNKGLIRVSLGCGNRRELFAICSGNTVVGA